jgi:DNA-binding CsgD family transcriptional regulator
VKLWQLHETWRAPTNALHNATIAALGRTSFPSAFFGELAVVTDIAGIVGGTLDKGGRPVADWTFAGSPDGFTDHCIRTYRSAFADSDPMHEARCRLLNDNNNGEILAGYVSADEISDPLHRAHIYDRFGLSGRLSLSKCVGTGPALCLTIVKHRDQVTLGPDETQRILDLAPTMFALLGKHRELSGALAMGNSDRKSLLLAKCPSLTSRELDLCVLLLEGRTLSSIAQEWSVKPTTVATYRDRAYARLDIHFRSELFALLHAMN